MYWLLEPVVVSCDGQGTVPVNVLMKLELDV
jgi:hypothetical protein